MEEFLQRAKSKLDRSKRLEKVHVVIGPKSCDLDSLISAFTYAYFLDKVSPPGILCLPVLNIPRTDFNYFTETRFILEELSISESFHIFRDEINLHQLNDEGKLSMTLVGGNVLASEDKTLESAVVKVINPVEQKDGEVELQEPSSSLVLKELLREAPELITEQLAHLLRGSILFKWMTMDPDQVSEKQEEILSILEEQFPNLPPREDIISVLQETQFSAQGLNIEQILLKDLKELTDGEIKVAISTVSMTLESCLLHSNVASDLKAFTDKFGFDVLILFASYLSEEQQPRRQIAVYSQNLELCSQICCELEECQNPCLELEPFECGCDEILVYQQEDPSVTCDQVVLLIKEVINRRCLEMVSNSRTSSTEAVAGSAPLSQGSSGIMELYGSDIEPQPSSVNFIENPPDLSDSNQAQVDVNVDLVSPDSGLATIRSSRSSKESSVFLSDDSPVGEGVGHHSLLPGFDSYSPIPEGAVVEEHARSGEHNEHFDLFHFDPAPMASEQSQPSSHSADYSPEEDFPNSDSSEEQLPAGPKELDEMGIHVSNYSSGFLLPESGKDGLVEFDEEFVQRQESLGDNSERDLSITGFMEDESPSSDRLKNMGRRIPPTPMNSFVENSPSTEEPTSLYTEDVTQKTMDAGHLMPPQTRTRCSSWWGGLDIDSKNVADAWSSSEQESVFQSPESWKDHKPTPVDRRASDTVFQPQNLEFPGSDPWESEFAQHEPGSKDTQDQEEETGPLENLSTEKSHLPQASPEGTNHLIEDFAALWHSGRSPTAMPEPWGNPIDATGPTAAMSFPAWSAFDKEADPESLKNTWNIHPTTVETPSVRDPSEWAMAKSGFSFSSEDLLHTPPSEANNVTAPKVWGRKNNDSRDNVCVSGNSTSNLEQTWNNLKPLREDQNGMVDSLAREKVYKTVDSWNLFEESGKKGSSDTLAPWEDSFFSYKCSDYSASNVGEDSVPSPLDTNYSTSDSYTSPTFAGDDKETENKPCAKEEAYESEDVHCPTEEAQVPAMSPQQAPRNRISSGPGNLDMWALPQVDDSCQGNAIGDSDKDSFKTEEHTDTKTVFLEEDEESNPSSYDNPSMMQLYNEANRQLSLLNSSTNSRQAAPDSLDTWNRVILEDTQSTATISDMDNELDWDDCSGGVAISNDGQTESYMGESTEPETRFSVKQLEPWGTEYQEANQVDWDLPTSGEHPRDPASNECYPLSEKSGQFIANNIWDSVMSNKDMSSLRSPDPAGVMDSAQSNVPPESPNHSSDGKDSHIPNLGDASGISESPPLTPPPSDNQNTWTGTVQADATSLTTRLENPGHFSHADPWVVHSYGQSEGEDEALGPSSPEPLDKEEVIGSRLKSDLEVSGKGSGDQTLFSPVNSEPQETCTESGKIRSLSVNCSPQAEEAEEDLCYEKVSYDSFCCDTQIEMSTGKFQTNEAYKEPLMNHRNSLETTEASGDREITKNASLSEHDVKETEECNILETESVNKEYPHECPQSLDVCDSPVDGELRDNHIDSEIMKNLDGDSIARSLPRASLTGNRDRDSVSSERTHSSTSSPDLNDSLAALSSWGQGLNTEHQVENQDSSEQICPDSELSIIEGQEKDISEMIDLEENRMDNSESNFGHMVSKFTEIWTESVDGDSLSSLSSPETGKYSEYSSVYQERNPIMSHQERDECDIAQPEDARVTSASSDSKDDSVGHEEPVEKDIHLTDTQVTQSASRTWDSMNESKFLAAEAPKSEEFSDYISSSEPIEKENTNPFCNNQQSSPVQWNESPHSEPDVQITAAKKETGSSPSTVKTGDDVWQIPPRSEPNNAVDSKLEMLGFSAENQEWWNAPPPEGRTIESALEGNPSDSSCGVEMNSSIYQDVGPWGEPIRSDTESMETYNTNPFSDKFQSPFLASPGDNSHEELWNIQPKQPDPDANQFSQLVILDQVKEKDFREQTFMSSAGDELPSETHTQEPCQNTMLSVWEQKDPAFTHMDENERVVSNVSTSECQGANWWEQGKYLSEMTPSNIATENHSDVRFPSELMRKPGSEWNSPVHTEGPQGTFAPDILHGNFHQGRRLASASPDLWVDVKQPFTVKADGENPDILTHCDQDGSSQASNSPDICHNSEVKQEAELHISVHMGPEVESSEFCCTEQKRNEEPKPESGQESFPNNSECYCEKAIPLPLISNQAHVSDSLQPAFSAGSLEPSEMSKEDNAGLKISGEEAMPDTAPILELVDRTIPRIENVGTDIFVTDQVPTEEGHSSWAAEDFSPESQTDARASFAGEEPLAPESPVAVADTLLASNICLDVSEAAYDHSFSDASGLNTSTGTIDDMSKLTLSEGHLETPVDGDAGKQDICSSEASWGDFEYDIMGQTIDEDLMKEPEHFHYGGDPLLEEDGLKQSLAPYTPPFDLSYLTEPRHRPETMEEAGSPENVSLGSEAAEMLLSALPDQNEGRHTEVKSRQAEHQRVVLHIHEDPAFISLPVARTGSNTESSPSNIDWDIETDNSDSPAGGDMGPPNAVSNEVLESKEMTIPTTEPEEITSEYKERCTEKNEEHLSPHVDYILVSHDQHSLLEAEDYEAHENTSKLENLHIGSEETGLAGSQLASIADTCQPASFTLESMSSKENERSSLKSPAQDQSWMVLGHSEVGDSEPALSGKTIEQIFDPSLGKSLHMQTLGEMKPLESLALEEVSNQGSQPGKSKSLGQASPDEVLLQVVSHDNEWEMLSPQPSQKNKIPELEVEETEFFEPVTGQPRTDGPLSDDVGMDLSFEEGALSPSSADMRPEPPNSLDLNGTHPRRIKLTAPNINLSLDQSEGSILSDDNLDSPDEIDINVDELDTPDEADSFDYTGHEDPMANKDSGQESESIPEYTAEEEREDNRLWRTVVIGEQEQRIDMKVIEPYRRVISHGGYYGDGLNAIIVFAACFLPDSSRADYHYVMENLFLYVISTLELMVAEDYMIVYLNGATPRRKMPGLGWMKKCYQMIDRRLRKNLKSFIIVHPSWFIRTILAVTRPFISSKFSSKIKYVSSLSELSGLIPMDCIHIPESIVKLDEELREASEAANIDLKLKEKP